MNVGPTLTRDAPASVMDVELDYFGASPDATLDNPLLANYAPHQGCRNFNTHTGR